MGTPQHGCGSYTDTPSRSKLWPSLGDIHPGGPFQFKQLQFRVSSVSPLNLFFLRGIGTMTLRFSLSEWFRVFASSGLRWNDCFSTPGETLESQMAGTDEKPCGLDAPVTHSHSVPGPVTCCPGGGFSTHTWTLTPPSAPEPFLFKAQEFHSFFENHWLRSLFRCL